MITYRTKDHPEANGRIAQADDVKWTWTFPLEDGSTLHIESGEQGRREFRAMILQCEMDDAVDEAQAKNTWLGNEMR